MSNQPSTCPRCGGQMVASTVRQMQLYLQPKAESGFFKSKASELDPFTCGECGYTEFYAQDPEMFKAQP